MNPAFQYQIFNPASGQFVQCDGGNDSTQALILQLLLQQIETNTYLRAMMLGQVPTDTGEQIRSDALLNTSLFQIG